MKCVPYMCIYINSLILCFNQVHNIDNNNNEFRPTLQLIMSVVTYMYTYLTTSHNRNMSIT